ncbi:ribokinase [Leifsonia sp. EB41]|uniref:ribokinase n=1 Tax=Leifsonia sp. EB41 TaxID=3156260 RepID=UPI003514D00B
MTHSRTPRALTLGSINQDIRVHVSEFPKPGETVLATSGGTALGGKGANQAASAALLGADVVMIGAVGNDGAGHDATQQLNQLGIATSHIGQVDETTGLAVITVDSTGENTIAVLPGANTRISAGDVEQHLDQLLTNEDETFSIAWSQGEVPPEAILAFSDRCRIHNIRFVLNLAPFVPVATEVLEAADPLIVNETEARALLESVGLDTKIDDPQSAANAAHVIATRVARSAIITRGSLGATISDGTRTWHEPITSKPDVVDTSGAGDAFVGAVIAALARGETLVEAGRDGVRAGTYAVARSGTIDSYPTSSEALAAAAVHA